MDNQKDKEPKGTAATASKMAASKRQVGDESPSPGQGATSSQNQGGTQNQGATGTADQSGSITPQQHHGSVGSQQNQGAGGGQDLMQQAKQTTGEVVSQVQQQASTQINRQKETAASELSTVVNAVRRFGETLSNEGQGPIARFAAQYGDKAANSLDKFATYIREQDAKRLLDDVQNFGRRQPALMIGGAFLLGFAGARLIRSSMEAASSDSGSMNMGTQRSMHMGTQGSMNMGTQGSMNMGTQGSMGMGTTGSMGAGGQSLNTNVSGAQPSTPPNTI
ncbi:MAG TPA: hypothetical protein VKB02_14095 [Pyrinomonadaceae bacterium]|nr:hypothetical protein [Pyrinomonadaceae bacterium]